MKFVTEPEGNIVILDLPKSFGDAIPVETVWLKMINEFTHGFVTATSEEGLLWEDSMIWQKVCHVEYVHHLISNIPL
jgi:hypothetical protein